MKKTKNTKTYSTIIRGKWIYGDSESIDDMINSLIEQMAELKALKDAGVELDTSGGPDDYFFLSTSDPAVAEKFGFSEDEELEDEE